MSATCCTPGWCAASFGTKTGSGTAPRTSESSVVSSSPKVSRTWERRRRRNTDIISPHLQWQSIQDLSKFHFGALDPTQGQLPWATSHFWEMITSQVGDLVRAALHGTRDICDTVLVFTSLPLMVTNFSSFILIAVQVTADHNLIFMLRLMKRVKGLLLRSLHKVNETK